jgi:hypothetical protein
LWLLAAVLALAGGAGLFWGAGRWRKAEAVARLEGERAEAEARLRAAMTEAERLDGPWQVADIEARREQIPDQGNSARTLLRVRAKLPPGWPIWEGSIFQDTLFRDVAPPDLWPEAQLAEVRAELTRAAAAIQEARRLADQPRGRLPVPWSQPSVGALGVTPDVGPAPLLLRYDALLCAQDGDLEGALLSCRALVNAGAAVGDTPTFAAQRFRVDTRDLAVLTLERVLALGQPPGPALAALQSRLAEEEAVPLMLFAARGERAALDQLCAAMLAGTVPVAAVLRYRFGEPEPPPDDDPDLARATSDLAVTHARAVILEKMNRKVEILKLPPELHGQLEELTASLKQEPPLVRALFGSDVVQSRGWRESQARLRCATVALAAERYRQQHDRWPERLADLVPAFLPAVPADPFDGAPLRYRRQQEGVVIYSLGQYLKDGGGLYDKSGLYPLYYNVVFRLWDPGLRRRPR